MGRAEDLFEGLLSSGEGGIEGLIRDRQAEELFLDFKRSADGGGGARLAEEDRNNFARAISGFGNSSGGVVVWGVQCSRLRDGTDLAEAKTPLADARKFAAWLDAAVSGCTVPPHKGVQNRPILQGQGPAGFVVTYAPESQDTPLQVVKGLQYYMRAGSSFSPVPHGVLAGLFGRRPQPDLVGQWVSRRAEIEENAVHLDVSLLVRNEGRGIARDSFINLKFLQMSGRNCHAKCEFLDNRNWTGIPTLGFAFSALSAPDFRLPPGAWCEPVMMQMELAPPFVDALKIERTDGCEGMPPRLIRIDAPAEGLNVTHRDTMAKYRAGTLTDEDYENLVGRFLNLG